MQHKRSTEKDIDGREVMQILHEVSFDMVSSAGRMRRT